MDDRDQSKPPPSEVQFVSKPKERLTRKEAKAADRKKKLEDESERLQFDDNAKELTAWIVPTKAKLKNAEIPRDVQTAEFLLNEHKDMADDIQAHEPEFEKIQALGTAVLGKTPGASDVKDKMKKLGDDKSAIDELYDKRLKDLQDAYDLQHFNKEADNIDSDTGNHEKLLNKSTLGSDLGDVEALYKRHEDLHSTLQAQEEKLKGLSDLADKLMADRHPDKDYIDKRRNDVLERRQKIKDQAAYRPVALLGSQAFHEFKRNAAELSQWMKEKYKTATDESYRDLGNLQEKLKKHQAFEMELKANNERLDQLNEQGNALIEDGHDANPEIKKTLKDVNAQWKDLYDKSMDKGQKLREAHQQYMLNKTLADAQKCKQCEKNYLEIQTLKQEIVNYTRENTKLRRQLQNRESDDSSSAGTKKEGSSDKRNKSVHSHRPYPTDNLLDNCIQKIETPAFSPHTVSDHTGLTRSNNKEVTNISGRSNSSSDSSDGSSSCSWSETGSGSLSSSGDSSGEELPVANKVSSTKDIAPDISTKTGSKVTEHAEVEGEKLRKRFCSKEGCLIKINHVHSRGEDKGAKNKDEDELAVNISDQSYLKTSSYEEKRVKGNKDTVLGTTSHDTPNQKENSLPDKKVGDTDRLTRKAEAAMKSVYCKESVGDEVIIISDTSELDSEDEDKMNRAIFGRSESSGRSRPTLSESIKHRSAKSIKSSSNITDTSESIVLSDKKHTDSNVKNTHEPSVLMSKEKPLISISHETHTSTTYLHSHTNGVTPNDNNIRDTSSHEEQSSELIDAKTMKDKDSNVKDFDQTNVHIDIPNMSNNSDKSVSDQVTRHTTKDESITTQYETAGNKRYKQTNDQPKVQVLNPTAAVNKTFKSIPYIKSSTDLPCVNVSKQSTPVSTKDALDGMSSKNVPHNKSISGKAGVDCKNSTEKISKATTDKSVDQHCTGRTKDLPANTKSSSSNELDGSQYLIQDEMLSFMSDTPEVKRLTHKKLRQSQEKALPKPYSPLITISNGTAMISDAIENNTNENKDKVVISGTPNKTNKRGLSNKGQTLRGEDKGAKNKDEDELAVDISDQSYLKTSSYEEKRVKGNKDTVLGTTSHDSPNQTGVKGDSNESTLKSFSEKSCISIMPPSESGKVTKRVLSTDKPVVTTKTRPKRPVKASNSAKKGTREVSKVDKPVVTTKTQPKRPVKASNSAKKGTREVSKVDKPVVTTKTQPKRPVKASNSAKKGLCQVSKVGQPSTMKSTKKVTEISTLPANKNRQENSLPDKKVGDTDRLTRKAEAAMKSVYCKESVSDEVITIIDSDTSELDSEDEDKMNTTSHDSPNQTGVKGDSNESTLKSSSEISIMSPSECGTSKRKVTKTVLSTDKPVVTTKTRPKRPVKASMRDRSETGYNLRVIKSNEMVEEKSEGKPKAKSSLKIPKKKPTKTPSAESTRLTFEDETLTEIDHERKSRGNSLDRTGSRNSLKSSGSSSPKLSESIKHRSAKSIKSSSNITDTSESIVLSDKKHTDSNVKNTHEPSVLMSKEKQTDYKVQAKPRSTEKDPVRKKSDTNVTSDIEKQIDITSEKTQLNLNPTATSSLNRTSPLQNHIGKICRSESNLCNEENDPAYSSAKNKLSETVKRNTPDSSKENASDSPVVRIGRSRSRSPMVKRQRMSRSPEGHISISCIKSPIYPIRRTSFQSSFVSTSSRRRTDSDSDEVLSYINTNHSSENNTHGSSSMDLDVSRNELKPETSSRPHEDLPNNDDMHGRKQHIRPKCQYELSSDGACVSMNMKLTLQKSDLEKLLGNTNSS